MKTTLCQLFSPYEHTFADKMHHKSQVKVPTITYLLLTLPYEAHEAQPLSVLHCRNEQNSALYLKSK